MLLDIICAVILVLFGLIGYFRGFARQIFGLLSGFVALVGAYFLLKPAYELLYNLFLSSIIESIGGTLGFLTFLDKIAVPVGKTTGALLTEYAFMFVVYCALVLIVGIAWKLLKVLVHPICDLRGIRVFDKIFGVLLGFVWAILLIVSVLYVAKIVAGWEKLGLTNTINDLINMLADGSLFSKRFIVNHLDKVETFFAEIWSLIRNGFATVKAA